MLLAFVLFASFPLGARTPDRVVTSLDAGWRVHAGDVPEGERPDLSDSDWLPATLPHTVNAGDGETGGGYYRGPSWYRRPLEVSEIPSDRRAFLQFDGAAVRADIFVNGAKLLRHDGGFAAFRDMACGATGDDRRLHRRSVRADAGVPWSARSRRCRAS